MISWLSGLLANSEAKRHTLAGHSLYYFATCPFCIKVLLALRQQGLAVELRNIHQDKAHLDALIAGGGKKTVPCLRIDSEAQTRWLYESDDIIAYLKSCGTAIRTD